MAALSQAYGSRQEEGRAQERRASSGDRSRLQAPGEAGSPCCLAQSSPGRPAHLSGQPAAGKILEGIVSPQQPVCFPSGDIASRA